VLCAGERFLSSSQLYTLGCAVTACLAVARVPLPFAAPEGSLPAVPCAIFLSREYAVRSRVRGYVYAYVGTHIAVCVYACVFTFPGGCMCARPRSLGSPH